jgi:hypothetical protein
LTRRNCAPTVFPKLKRLAPHFTTTVAALGGMKVAKRA